MKSQTSVRIQFWLDHPQFQHLYQRRLKQNDYPTDVRVAFIDYVDNLARSGQITEKLAGTVTL